MKLQQLNRYVGHRIEGYVYKQRLVKTDGGATTALVILMPGTDNPYLSKAKEIAKYIARGRKKVRLRHRLTKGLGKNGEKLQKVILQLNQIASGYEIAKLLHDSSILEAKHSERLLPKASYQAVKTLKKNPSDVLSRLEIIESVLSHSKENSPQELACMMMHSASFIINDNYFSRRSVVLLSDIYLAFLKKMLDECQDIYNQSYFHPNTRKSHHFNLKIFKNMIFRMEKNKILLRVNVIINNDELDTAKKLVKKAYLDDQECAKLNSILTHLIHYVNHLRFITFLNPILEDYLELADQMEKALNKCDYERRTNYLSSIVRGRLRKQIFLMQYDLHSAFDGELKILKESFRELIKSYQIIAKETQKMIKGNALRGSIEMISAYYLYFIYKDELKINLLTLKTVISKGAQHLAKAIKTDIEEKEKRRGPAVLDQNLDQLKEAYMKTMSYLESYGHTFEEIE